MLHISYMTPFRNLAEDVEEYWGLTTIRGDISRRNNRIRFTEGKKIDYPIQVMNEVLTGDRIWNNDVFPTMDLTQVIDIEILKRFPDTPICVWVHGTEEHLEARVDQFRAAMQTLGVPETIEVNPPKGRACFQFATFFETTLNPRCNQVNTMKTNIERWRKAGIYKLQMRGYKTYHLNHCKYMDPMPPKLTLIDDANITDRDGIVTWYNEMVTTLKYIQTDHYAENNLITVKYTDHSILHKDMFVESNKSKHFVMDDNNVERFPLRGTPNCYVYFVDPAKFAYVEDEWRRCRMKMRKEVAHRVNVLPEMVRFEGLDAALLIAIIKALGETNWVKDAKEQEVLIHHLIDILGKPESGIVGNTMIEVLLTEFNKKFNTWVEKMYEYKTKELFDSVKSFIGWLQFERDEDGGQYKYQLGNSCSEIETKAREANMPELRPVEREQIDPKDPIRLYLNERMTRILDIRRMDENTKTPYEKYSERGEIRKSWYTLKTVGGRYTLNNVNPTTALNESIKPLLEFVKNRIASFGDEAKGLHVACYGGAVVSIVGGLSARDIDLCFTYDPTSDTTITDRCTLMCAESMPSKEEKARLNKVIKKILTGIFKDVDKGVYWWLQPVRKDKDNDKKKKQKLKDNESDDDESDSDSSSSSEDEDIRIDDNGAVAPPRKKARRIQDDSYQSDDDDNNNGEDDDDDQDSSTKITKHDDEKTRRAKELAQMEKEYKELEAKVTSLKLLAMAAKTGRGKKKNYSLKYKKRFESISNRLAVLYCDILIRTPITYRGTEVEFATKLKKPWSNNASRGFPYDVFAYLDENGDIAVKATNYTKFCLQNGRFWLPDPSNPFVGLDKKANKADFVRSMISASRIGSYILNKGFMAHVSAPALYKGMYTGSPIKSCMVPWMTPAGQLDTESVHLPPFITQCGKYLSEKFQTVLDDL